MPNPIFIRDRYVLKLFRDYMFHQALSDGAPVLDAGTRGQGGIVRRSQLVDEKQLTLVQERNIIHPHYSEYVHTDSCIYFLFLRFSQGT